MTMAIASGPTVLITGCSSGIGRATALLLSRERFAVYATARNAASLQELKSAGCRVLPLDVNEDASMSTAVAAVEAERGAIDVLVNNAGYSQSGALESVPMARVRAQFETNVFGLIRMTQLVLPAMRRQRRGTIVNIGSLAGKFTFPGGAFYHATKHSVEAISDALRLEVRPFGINVVLIEPGLIRTQYAATLANRMDGVQMPDDEGGRSYAAFNEAMVKTIADAYVQGPLSRLAGKPDDVARTILRAIRSPKPKARYSVSPSAKLILGLRWLLPDRMFDALLRSGFPLPKP
jgi:NAD(P)-dependent dehydrogenase (short-subunit alcohol dehydrogenase family)